MVSANDYWIEDEVERVFRWRKRELKKLQITKEYAELMARSQEVDLNQARLLAAQGATPDQIVRMLL